MQPITNRTNAFFTTLVDTKCYIIAATSLFPALAYYMLRILRGIKLTDSGS